MKSLHQLISQFPYAYEWLNEKEVTITGMTSDSRNVADGHLFICIKGYTVDGHDYIDQAVNQGAVAVIVEKEVVRQDIAVIRVNDSLRVMSYLANRLYNFPTNDLHMIGITGTNGKTSITYLLEAIFKQHQEKTALIGTIQLKIGEETFPIKNTTPEPSFLFQHFALMQEAEVDHCIMEVSSHALKEGRVRGIDYDIAVLTNLTQDHLDFHQTMADYRHAKERLFQQLGNRYDSERPKYAIINLDDAHSASFIDVTAQPVITYGLSEASDIYAKDIELYADHSKYTVVVRGEAITIETKLIGEFNVYNSLAAIAVAYVSNVPLAVIASSFATIKGVKGRFEAVDSNKAYSVIIDYAHTPDSLENVLETARSFAKGKVYCVIGCGGDRDKTKRPLMAEVSDRLSDYTLLTSDNPRSEDPLQIIEDMKKGMQSSAFTIEVDRRLAIKKAISKARAGDVIIIAGKGHETYQIINGKTYPFDDYQIAQTFMMKDLGEDK